MEQKFSCFWIFFTYLRRGWDKKIKKIFYTLNDIYWPPVSSPIHSIEDDLAQSPSGLSS